MNDLRKVDSSKLAPLGDVFVETLNPEMGYYFKAAEKLYETETEYQTLEVFEFKHYGRVLRLDGVFQTSYRDEYLYHEPLVHVPGLAIDGPKTALVIGGGDGGAAEEFLKYASIEKVTMVELDQGVVEASEKYLPEISKGAFKDSRLDLRFEDGIEYIRNTGEKFDQVMLDLTDPFGPSVALYTQEFYHSISEILTPNGLLSLHIESPVSRPSVFAGIYRTLESVFRHVTPMFNYVPMYGALWGFAVASNAVNVRLITEPDLETRFEKHDLPDLNFLNADTYKAIMAVPGYIAKILDHEGPVYTLEHPIQLEEEPNMNLFLCEEK